MDRVHYSLLLLVNVRQRLVRAVLMLLRLTMAQASGPQQQQQ
jgi:hypothetical protein